MSQEQRELYAICPDCGHKAIVKIKPINIEDISRIGFSEHRSQLKSIAEKTGIPISDLFDEASKIAESLEAALPVLESMHNICSTCGNLKQERTRL
jgi:hypothetical protein